MTLTELLTIHPNLYIGANDCLCDEEGNVIASDATGAIDEYFDGEYVEVYDGRYRTQYAEYVRLEFDGNYEESLAWIVDNF